MGPTPSLPRRLRAGADNTVRQHRPHGALGGGTHWRLKTAGQAAQQGPGQAGPPSVTRGAVLQEVILSDSSWPCSLPPGQRPCVSVPRHQGSSLQDSTN